MNSLCRIITILTLSFFTIAGANGQSDNTPDSSLKYKTISAGPQYKRSGWHNFFWGKNYRKEWSTPVKLPVLLLDSTYGGLKPIKAGGGHQTTSLHMETKDGKNYSIRSVDKRLGKVLPDNFKGSFVESVLNDEVSMSNPYGALTVAPMARAAGIYHTTPVYVYLPKQAALDTFDEKYPGKVYLLEQRLKGDWTNADNLGNFDKYYDTSYVLKKLMEESEYHVDQAAFAKDRLFDMFLGDWDRHEDQWAWGELKKGKEKWFVPVPQDRDQVFFKHNGVALDAGLSAAGIGYMQSFKGKISNVKKLTYEERGIDRLFTNQLVLADWQNAAKQLQESLTDNVIEEGVKRLPPEIFAISGESMIKNLKSRRNHLLEYASTYYLFLAKYVEILGTTNDDFFDVNRLSNKETLLNIYKLNKEGIKKDMPYYSRTFLTSETKEIRIFGLAGNDIYITEGKVNRGIRIKIIGGYDKDSIVLNSKAGHATKTFIYDGHDDYIQSSGRVKKRLSNDSSVHQYEYRDYVYDKRGIKPSLFYSDEDRIFVGLGYGWTHNAWRKLPYVFKQDIGVHYSLSQHALSFSYTAIFPNTIGKWDLSLLANYDAIRWTNFYGLGNESILTTKNLDYNRMRSKGATFNIGLSRKTLRSYIDVHGFYQSIQIISDPARYTYKVVSQYDSTVFNQKNFAGVAANYNFSKVNDPIVPTSGIQFSGDLSFTQNINVTDRSFWKYGGTVHLYVPLFYKFSLAIAGGAESVSGSPEFYQFPSIGGGQDLRGFQRQRFYGKTSFYNSNELRFISNVRSYIFNGKAGLLAFVDDGRVWMPGEKSNILHTGYGGGIVLAPFNLVFVDITYGFSNEDRLLQFRLNLKL
jgi:Omp85 superfamily domain